MISFYENCVDWTLYIHMYSITHPYVISFTNLCNKISRINKKQTANGYLLMYVLACGEPLVLASNL